jgi:hypothetical protein
MDLGHFDEASPNLESIRVRLDPSETASASSGPTESTNTFRAGFGGDPFRFVAHCKYPSGAEYELEFLVRLGL